MSPKTIPILTRSVLACLTLGYLTVAQQCAPALPQQIIDALRVMGKGPSDFRLPGSLPDPSKPAGTDMLPGIDHIVALMMENHSFDNIWGTLDREDVDILPVDNCTGKPSTTNPFANGTLLHSYEMPMTCVRTLNSEAPSPNWLSSHLQYDNGSMDGFVTGNGPKPIHMGYFTPTQLPFEHSLAKTFPIGDRYFCSVLGQTWPNRMYFIAATSLGIVDTGQNLTGCPMVPTIFDRLNDYGISWTSYVAGYGQADAEATLQLFPGDAATFLKNGATLNRFFQDARSGSLPSFSFIDLNGTTQTQENPQNVVVGEAVMSDIVHALGNSPQWNRTLLLINYDEHGGYFDHVAPPVALAPDSIEPIIPAATSDSTGNNGYEYQGYQRYGFRVPNIVISPYSKKNHVSHVVHDHTSLLALIEKKWNLPALTYRDANANNLLEYIDLNALAQGNMNFPDINALNLSKPGNTTANLACNGGSNLIWPPPEAYQEPVMIPNLTYSNLSVITASMATRKRSLFTRSDFGSPFPWRDFFMPLPPHGTPDWIDIVGTP